MTNLYSKLKSIPSKIKYKYWGYYYPQYRKKVEADFKNLPLNSPDKVSAYISNLLETDSPCMISRFGSNELSAALCYGRNFHPLWFLRKIAPFWAPPYIANEMKSNAGFFSNDKKNLSDFADLLLSSAEKVDLLGSWIGSERMIEEKMGYERCPLLYLEPYWSKKPWTKSLQGKNVLVIHPFASTIQLQYSKHRLLFDNPDLLPPFNLKVIKAIQSIGGDNNGFNSWFDALHYMEKQIDSIDYDIALIGCGAYGMPLAAYCKETGKKAVHLGGVLQLLFGIKGNRWAEDGYGSDFGFDYKRLLDNPNWVKPLPEETPIISKKIENACYW